MTREEIENLKIGDLIQRSYSDIREILAGSGIWSKPVPVESIIFRGVSVTGHVYVIGYIPFGDSGNTHISFSTNETDRHVRMAKAFNHTDGLVGVEQRSFCGDSA